jgi:diamine N-acetyltransferase
MHIRQAFPDDIPVINRIAHATWWPTYGSILSEQQIAFMLEEMYAPASLEQQMNDGASFYLVLDDGHTLGFASCSPADADTVKLNKLYVLPDAQGSGAGRLLVTFVKDEAKKQGASRLQLNVQRQNPALGFYLKCGFRIQKEVDIPYHHFMLNDYVLEAAL